MINKAIRLVSSDGYSSYTKSILVGFESEEQIQAKYKELNDEYKKATTCTCKKEDCECNFDWQPYPVIEACRWVLKQKTTTSTWAAVDKDGTECIFEAKPTKAWNRWIIANFHTPKWVDIPKGSIKALIGRELTWNDEPIELKEPVSPCIDCECAKFADEVIKPNTNSECNIVVKRNRAYL